MKLLILFSDDLFIRNYLDTGAFDGLEGHERLFAVADDCRKKEAVMSRPGFAGLIHVRKDDERRHFELLNILMWANRKKSRTFWYRFSRFYRTYRKPTPRNLLRNLKGFLGSLKYRILGGTAVAPWYVPRFAAAIPVNPDLESIIRKEKPDLVVFPSAAYDPIGNDAARIARTLGIPTLFLIDNWDNLSSKSIFWAKPDYLGVWGEQSRGHAVDIHGMDRDRIFNIGTPRFQSYYEVDRKEAPSHFPFEYILFCGVALAFDELAALRRLDDEISAHPDIYGETRIVYRPHPYRQPRFCPDVFRPEDFKSVVMDPQVKEAYYRLDTEFHPSLDYYPRLLAKARMVVCPLTTMLIETLICGTPVLAITYDDGIHYTSPHNALKYYLHFEGVERIRGLSFCSEVGSLGIGMRGLFQQPPGIGRREILDSLDHFIHDDGRGYAHRLGAMVNSIAARKGRETGGE